MTVFKLKSYSIKTYRNKYNTAVFNQKRLWFDVETEELGLFTTIETAERQIKKHIELCNKYLEQYHEKDLNTGIGFMLFEVPVDEGYVNHHDSRSAISFVDEYICDFKSVRTYLADGSYFCSYDYDSEWEKPFSGCLESDVKFKEGDIALAVYDDCATFVKIKHTPPTKQWWKENIKGGPGDGSDFSYMVIEYQNDHNHINSYRMFPVVLPTTFKRYPEIEEKLDEYEKEYDAWVDEQNRRYENEHKNDTH